MLTFKILKMEKNIRKLYITLTMLAAGIVIVGCNKTRSAEHSPLLAGDCVSSSFYEGISMYSNNNNVYIIKGIVLDKIEYGLSIKLVEDLKKNFPKDVSTFTVWGNGSTFIELNRLDNLALYNKQDVLIMLLTPTRDLLAEMVPQGHKWLEKPEDYATLGCTYSVLKLSGVM